MAHLYLKGQIHPHFICVIDNIVTVLPLWHKSDFCQNTIDIQLQVIIDKEIKLKQVLLIISKPVKMTCQQVAQLQYIYICYV